MQPVENDQTVKNDPKVKNDPTVKNDPKVKNDPIVKNDRAYLVYLRKIPTLQSIFILTLNCSNTSQKCQIVCNHSRMTKQSKMTE